MIFNYPSYMGLNNPLGDKQILAIFPPGIEQNSRRRTEIAAAWGAQTCAVNTGAAHEEFRQLVAKVAHAFAVAHIGLENFDPLLTNFIRGRKSEDGPLYVGCDYRRRPRAQGLHELWLEHIMFGTKVMAVVRVRLFGGLGAPEYIALVGWLRPGVCLHVARYSEPGPVLPLGTVTEEQLFTFHFGAPDDLDL